MDVAMHPVLKRMFNESLHNRDTYYQHTGLSRRSLVDHSISEISSSVDAKCRKIILGYRSAS